MILVNARKEPATQYKKTQCSKKLIKVARQLPLIWTVFFDPCMYIVILLATNSFEIIKFSNSLSKIEIVALKIWPICLDVTVKAYLQSDNNNFA